jgi:hypothetical protein
MVAHSTILSTDLSASQGLQSGIFCVYQNMVLRRYNVASADMLQIFAITFDITNYFPRKRKKHLCSFNS